MALSLPPDPSLKQLRNLAKDVVKAHKAGDATCCSVLRNLTRLADVSEEEVLATDVSLADAQFALALDYGFKSWAKLKAHVEANKPIAPKDLATSRESVKSSAAAVVWPELKYGFRQDPMKWVRSDESAGAAFVRQAIFTCSKEGDEKIMETRLQEVFAKQRPDGSLEDEHDQGVLAATGETLVSLLREGCSPQRPEVQRALAALEKGMDELPPEKESNAACYALEALCLADRTGHPAVEGSLKRLAGELPGLLARGCPGTPFVQIRALWAGRRLVDAGGAIQAGLEWIENALQPPGCSKQLGLCHPGYIAETIAGIDHPAASRIAGKLVPMLLRSQEPDGGFGEDGNTLYAIMTLKEHGLLDKLRGLPPLPPDWKTIRCIPAPVTHNASVIACDGDRIWMNDPNTATAVAIATEDGRVLQTTPLAKVGGCIAFGVWDGSLWALPGGPKDPTKTLYRVDPETGDVQEKIPIEFPVRHFAGLVKAGGKVVISDQWEGCAWVMDLERKYSRPYHVRLAAGMPGFLAAKGDEIWALDSWAPAMVRTNMEGDLLDWGEKPFGWGSVAWDGKRLWALDEKNKRICQIEKTESGKELTTAK